MHLTSHRPMLAGTGPIDHGELGLRVVRGFVHEPRRDEVIVVCLDDARAGIVVVGVTGTQRPESIVDVVELVTSPAAHGGRVDAVIVASVRTTIDDECTADGDVDRWMEISDIADDHGVELLEWFVVGPDGTSCPRDRLGEPPRW